VGRRFVLASGFALAAVLAGKGVSASQNAQIEIWSASFYSMGAAGAPPLPYGRALPPEAVCGDAILKTERDNGLDDHSLLAMGFTEAGRMTPDKLFTVWPWTVDTEGKSYYFPTRDDAIAFVREKQAAGIQSIDVGCLQVNLRWHPDAFPDLVTAFDPYANVRYAASYLQDLRRQHGDLDTAIAYYHSAQSELGGAYRKRVAGNMRWAAGAIDYLRTLAAVPVLRKPQTDRLAFLLPLYTNADSRPLLPVAAKP
jgi:hypothetical protein